MTQVIIYQNDQGRVSIISPSQEWIDLVGIDAIAAKDVPAPKIVYDVPTGTFETDDETGEVYEVMGPRLKTYPYKIMDAADLPADRSQRMGWTVDEADLTDGVGAEWNDFSERETPDVAD